MIFGYILINAFVAAAHDPGPGFTILQQLPRFHRMNGDARPRHFYAEIIVDGEHADGVFSDLARRRQRAASGILVSGQR